MSLKKSRHLKGIILVPDTSALESIEGEIKVDSSDNKLKATLGASAREIVTNSQTQTLSNKTLTSPVLNTGVSGSAIDTDVALTADSDTLLASQKATKAYADAVAASASSDLSDHITDAVDAHDASAVSFAPTGTLSSTDVQAMGAELDGDIQAHITDATDAHDASAISFSPIGNLSSTDVQAMGAELDTQLTNHELATSGVHGVTGSVVGTSDSQTLTNKTITGASIRTPTRLDVKQDTRSNLETYATSATNGQLVFATDDKQMFQVVDNELVSVGGAGIIKITAGESLSLRDLVYISTGTGNDSGRTAGRAYKVDASNDDRVEVAGFISKAGNAGAIIEIQTSGILEGFAGLTAGKPYYASASSPGAITLTPPSSNGQWVVAVALAATATDVVINPVASASAIYVVDAETSFTIANNQASLANITDLSFDGGTYRGFIIDYTIYRQTDTASSALAQIGQLRGAFNTQAGVWYMSDDYSAENSGVTLSIAAGGQVQYTSTDISGANYVGTMKYTIRKTFGV